MKKKGYYDFEIDYLEKYEYENLRDEDKESLLELRNLNRRRNQHEKWIDKHQKIVDEYSRRLGVIKEIKITEKDVFDDISLLKKIVIPLITISKKIEKSKSLKNQIKHYKRNTYRGEPLKEREVWSCVVRLKGLTSKNQKNIYLGSKETVEKVLNTYYSLTTVRSENQFKTKTESMLRDYFTPLLQNGWGEFGSIGRTYPFQSLIKPWLEKNKK